MAALTGRLTWAGDSGRWRSRGLAALGSLVVSLSISEWIGGRASVLSVPPGSDLELYLCAARRWLAGAGFYPASQFAGPHAIDPYAEVLYPPTTVPLFAAFTVLPAVLWWAVPAAVAVAAVALHRPSRLALGLIAVALATPWTLGLLIAGNPAMWACAALAVATHRPALGPLVLLKPSLAPLALFGAWERRWWVLLAVGALYALAFAPMWLDYLAVLRNLDGGRAGGLAYSVGDLSLMAVPLLARLGTRRRTASGP